MNRTAIAERTGQLRSGLSGSGDKIRTALGSAAGKFGTLLIESTVWTTFQFVAGGKDLARRLRRELRRNLSKTEEAALSEGSRRRTLIRRILVPAAAVCLTGAAMTMALGGIYGRAIDTQPADMVLAIGAEPAAAADEQIAQLPAPEAGAVPSVPVPVQLGDFLNTMSDAEELDISGNDLTGLDVDGFLGAMTNLKRINMKDCGLENEEYAALQEAHPDTRIIWNICVKGYVIPTDAVGFSCLLADETQPRLTNDDIKYLKYCRDMVALDLGHNHITNLDFLKYMPDLRVLILVDNYSLENGWQYLTDISALKYVPHLRYLELFSNGISDMSVIAELKELEDLNICYNPVSSAEPFMDLPHLQKFWVYNTYIPFEQLVQLYERYPNAWIVTAGDGSVDQGWRDGAHYWAMRNMVINNVIDDVYRTDPAAEAESAPATE